MDKAALESIARIRNIIYWYFLPESLKADPPLVYGDVPHVPEGLKKQEESDG